MLMPIDTTIEKLMFFRDVVFPFVREKEKAGEVDFNTFECGTTKCLLGWCGVAFYDQLGISPDQEPNDVMRTLTGKGNGGYDVWWHEIFGLAANGDLDNRAAAIDRIIERKLQEAMP